MKLVRQCFNCKHWEDDFGPDLKEYIGSHSGFCKRYPPNPQNDDDSGYPNTGIGASCGEFLANDDVFVNSIHYQKEVWGFVREA